MVITVHLAVKNSRRRSRAVRQMIKESERNISAACKQDFKCSACVRGTPRPIICWSVCLSVGALTSARASCAGDRPPTSTPSRSPYPIHPSIHPLPAAAAAAAAKPAVVLEAARTAARARAIEAFSNFRSVEAPGWTAADRPD